MAACAIPKKREDKRACSFKQTLLEIRNKSMREQGSYLEQFIKDWRNGCERVDDNSDHRVRL